MLCPRGCPPAQKRTGTREWSDKSLNIQCGCEHNCLYCYARANALWRRWIKNKEEWKTPRFYEKGEKPKKTGRIMFPTTHDITPLNVDRCISFLKPWLGLGNEVLIVSKPHLPVIKQICEELECYKNRISFRFTIGSLDQHILDFWEHDAPQYHERYDCLKWAYNAGWKTSVSSEPYLDTTIQMLVKTLEPYLDVIWIGKMNKIKERLKPETWPKEDLQFLDIVRKCQTDEFIRKLYNDLITNDKVKWKDSIKEVLGLEQEPIG